LQHDRGTTEMEFLNAHKRQEQIKKDRISVDKCIPLLFDMHHLLVSDMNPVDEALLTSTKTSYLKREMYLISLARDNCQLLVNQLFTLPIETTDDGVIVATLPASKTILPREKPLPKRRELTKWDKFAKTKGIKNKKKLRMEFDEVKQDFIPIHGYKSKANDEMQDWMIEVKKNDDPYENPHSKKRENRKAVIAKNAKRNRKNRKL